MWGGKRVAFERSVCVVSYFRVVKMAVTVTALIWLQSVQVRSETLIKDDHLAVN